MCRRTLCHTCKGSEVMAKGRRMCIGAEGRACVARREGACTLRRGVQSAQKWLQPEAQRTTVSTTELPGVAFRARELHTKCEPQVAGGTQLADALLGFGPEREDGLPRLPRGESRSCHDWLTTLTVKSYMPLSRCASLRTRRRPGGRRAASSRCSRPRRTCCGASRRRGGRRGCRGRRRSARTAAALWCSRGCPRARGSRRARRRSCRPSSRCRGWGR